MVYNFRIIFSKHTKVAHVHSRNINYYAMLYAYTNLLTTWLKIIIHCHITGNYPTKRYGKRPIVKIQEITLLFQTFLIWTRAAFSLNMLVSGYPYQVPDQCYAFQCAMVVYMFWWEGKWKPVYDMWCQIQLSGITVNHISSMPIYKYTPV